MFQIRLSSLKTLFSASGKKAASRALLLFWIGLQPGLYAQVQRPVFEGQQPAREVDTTSRPVEKQKKGVFSFPEDGISFSNDFDGARLNGIERLAADSYQVFISPENSPVNPSPWYAFKIWSEKKQNEVKVKLVYPEKNRHRYSPLISKNGKDWKPLEAARIEEIEKGTDAFGPDSRPRQVVLSLNITKKALWVSAQELEDSSRVFRWMEKLAGKRKLQVDEIGKSKEGKPLRMISIGNRDSKKMIFVISRQHPPEVTGYFAMQAFVEKLADNSRLSKKFRKEWGAYVVPLMNPDGVDAGHWRHNAGGIDLNRDWAAFNQPETSAIKAFLKMQAEKNQGKFYFGIDFHSTWDDIYYPMAEKYKGNMPGLVHEWLASLQTALPGYAPNIRPNENLHPTSVSRNYFFAAHGMEAIVFEIGDNTPRDFIRKKGEAGAEKLMELLLRPKSQN